jgi:hypothetical protein
MIGAAKQRLFMSAKGLWRTALKTTRKSFEQQCHKRGKVAASHRTESLGLKKKFSNPCGGSDRLWQVLGIPLYNPKKRKTGSC